MVEGKGVLLVGSSEVATGDPELLWVVEARVVLAGKACQAICLLVRASPGRLNVIMVSSLSDFGSVQVCDTQGEMASARVKAVSVDGETNAAEVSPEVTRNPLKIVEMMVTLMPAFAVGEMPVAMRMVQKSAVAMPRARHILPFALAL